MLKKTSKVLTLLLIISLTACRTTFPVLTPLTQPEDQYLTCDEIINEIDQMDEHISVKQKDMSDQISSNIALATVGLYLFHVATGFYYFLVPIPLIFMDFSDGHRADAKSAVDRYEYLQGMYDQKWCSIRN